MKDGGQRQEQTQRQIFEAKLEVCSTGIKVRLLSSWCLELACGNVTPLPCPRAEKGKAGVVAGTVRFNGRGDRAMGLTSYFGDRVSDKGMKEE